MTIKTKKASPPDGAKPAPVSKAIPIFVRDDKEKNQSYAETVLAPDVAAWRVVNAAEAKSGLGTELDTSSAIGALIQQAQAVNGGDLRHVEAVVVNQATALQSLFVRLVERGMSCDTVGPFEINMRIALRAQAQCRATLEALAAIRNPPVVIARQANIASGPQQVNNAAVPSRARENEIPPNQLLEADHGERLDASATGAAGGRNPALATVGNLDRAQDTGG